MRRAMNIAMRAAAFLGALLGALAFSGTSAPPLAAEVSSELPAPLTDADYRAHPPEMARLGQALFYDKLLSGGLNISCGSCHDHTLASGDGLSLGLGEGASGLGEYRLPRHKSDAVAHRVPRNAPGMFNLGARAITAMFWDGRLEVDASQPSGFRAPAKFDIPQGLSSVVAAQALFPITSEVEMSGERHENEIALAAARRPALAWPLIAKRVGDTPAYWPLISAAYPALETPGQLEITHLVNAIAAFIETEWRADNSAFDRYLRGEAEAISAEAKRGAKLFYGSAGCAACHSGPLQTDNGFHAIAMPQLGPGRMPIMRHVFSDFGRMAATGERQDAYRFRTPSLRNVAETAPYGHSGAYPTLEAVIRHHLNPKAAFTAYDSALAVLPSDAALDARDWRAMQDPRERRAILRANQLKPSSLNDGEIAALIAFLESLTDQAALKGRLGKPQSVPSGLAPD